MAEGVKLGLVVERWWRLRPALRLCVAGIFLGAASPLLGRAALLLHAFGDEGALGAIFSSWPLSFALVALIWLVVVLAAIPPVETSLAAYLVRLAGALGEVVGTMGPPRPVVPARQASE